MPRFDYPEIDMQSATAFDPRRLEVGLIVPPVVPDGAGFDGPG
jgi:hypothetical protein